MAKRYIITTVSGVSAGDAARALGVKQASVKDAVMALESDDYKDDTDVLAVEELGIYTKTISDDEAAKLRRNRAVLGVEEDDEVFALTDDMERVDGFGEEGCTGVTDEFHQGYSRALEDVGAFLEKMNQSRFREEDIARYVLQLRARKPRGPGRRDSSLLQPIPWNISMVNAEKTWQRTTGRGISVAILDTGIDDDHPDLRVCGGVSFVPNIKSWDDDHSHGTHCAGIVAARNDAGGIVGVAPEAELYAVKVLSARGSGQTSWILAGMGWCVRNRIRVASLSLGSNVHSPDTPCSIAYQTAAERLAEAGCVVVAAAGNSGRESNHWVGQPARCSGFMAVAAVDRNGRKADFSSWGPPSLDRLEGVEISAPGVAIRSTTPGGRYSIKSGTSMACPHVSGAAALVAEIRPTWSPAQIRERLKATAGDLGSPGNDPQTGTGLLDCLAAIS